MLYSRSWYLYSFNFHIKHLLNYKDRNNFTVETPWQSNDQCLHIQQGGKSTLCAIQLERSDKTHHHFYHIIIKNCVIWPSGNIWKTEIDGQSTKWLICDLKVVKDMKIKGRLRNCSILKEFRGLWLLVAGGDPGSLWYRRYQKDNCWNLNVSRWRLYRRFLCCSCNFSLTLKLLPTKLLLVCAQSLSCVWLFVTLWTIAPHAPLSMEFSNQEYWCGLPSLSPGNLPDPGIKPGSPVSPALAGRFFTTAQPWMPP